MTSSLAVWQDSHVNYLSLERVFDHVFDYEFKFLGCEASRVFLCVYMLFISSDIFQGIWSLHTSC